MSAKRTDNRSRRWCRFCGRDVVYSTYRNTPGAMAEPDYDPGNDPVTWRHRGGYAACGTHFADPRPEIVTLCGSTRFFDVFMRANYDLTMAGAIVLSVGFYPHSPEAHGEGVGATSEQKIALDELHKRKIDLCDRVLVLNVGGYIGDSTRSEIDYAEAHGKPVDWLEPREPSGG